MQDLYHQQYSKEPPKSSINNLTAPASVLRGGLGFGASHHRLLFGFRVPEIGKSSMLRWQASRRYTLDQHPHLATDAQKIKLQRAHNELLFDEGASFKMM